MRPLTSMEQWVRHGPCAARESIYTRPWKAKQMFDREGRRGRCARGACGGVKDSEAWVDARVDRAVEDGQAAVGAVDLHDVCAACQCGAARGRDRAGVHAS